MNFYTYLWLREDGTPYYVGKGKDGRAFDNSNRKVTKKPKDVSNIVIQHYVSEEEAFEAEEFFISYFGRQDVGTGILQNRTNGGDGAAGRVLSEEHKRKIGIGCAHSPRSLGMKLTKETRVRMSLAASHSPKSAEVKKKMSESQKRRWECRRAQNVETSLS